MDDREGAFLMCQLCEVFDIFDLAEKVWTLNAYAREVVRDFRRSGVNIYKFDVLVLRVGHQCFGQASIGGR